VLSVDDFGHIMFKCLSGSKVQSGLNFKYDIQVNKCRLHHLAKFTKLCDSKSSPRTSLFLSG